MTTAVGIVSIVAAVVLSAATCARGARPTIRPTAVYTLVGLVVAALLGCLGASLVASGASTPVAVTAFAVSAAGVSLPVVTQTLRSAGQRRAESSATTRPQARRGRPGR